MDLFGYKAEHKKKAEAPLADRMRPRTLEEFFGQAELVGAEGVLRTLIEGDAVPSMLFWGPPGTGKTTLARIIARRTEAKFVQLSAVTSGLAELRAVAAEAKEARIMRGRRTIVFVDEIHRWNKAQQDAFLPLVEEGEVTLIGATTENPSFAVNAALLSRCRVFTFSKLEGSHVERILRAALGDEERGIKGAGVDVDAEAIAAIARIADGDARTALGMLETAALLAKKRGRRAVAEKDVGDALQRAHVLYDKGGEEHYNIISALHKSLRGSDVNASLYWLGRMLAGGEDPRYVARRLIRFASEDVGLADPMALLQANAAFDAAERIGMPECSVNLAQAAAYLAKAPKSNALYVAMGRIEDDIRNNANDPVPLHLRNAPTRLMKGLGYGEGYVYPPSAKGEVRQDYLPLRLRGTEFFEE